MRRTALLTTICCALAGAAPAAAFELRLGPVPPPGVALGGDLLLRVETRGRGVELLGTSLSTGETRVLHSLQPRSEAAEVFIGAIDASPAGYAFLTFGREPGFGGGASIAAARFGSPPRYLRACVGSDPSVEGDVVATGGCGVSLFGLDEGTEPRELRPSPANGPQLAGALVAWREGTRTVVVADAHDGRVRTRVDAGPGRWSYTLGADGTVAVVREMRVRRRGVTRSLQQVFAAEAGTATLRRLPLAAWPYYRVLMDGGVMVVQRYARPDFGIRGQLLAGGPRGFRYLVRSRTVVSFDVEDGRVAWSALRRGASSLHVEPARAN